MSEDITVKKSYKNIGLKDYFKRYGIKYGLKRLSFTALPVHIVKDYENKKLLYYRKIEKYLYKYYKYADSDPVDISYGVIDIQAPVWIYWNTGFNNAPPIIKACVASVKKYEGDRLILLSDENVNNYVKLPDYIKSGLNSGEIPLQVYSDIIRYTLLEHFGGTWLDSTVYLTDKLPASIVDADVFAFRDSFGPLYNPAYFCNWLIHCNPHNKIIRETRNMVFAYWKHEKHIVEYLLNYFFFTFAVKKNNAVEDIPYLLSDYSHQMEKLLYAKYDDDCIKRYEHICSLTPIHKITYKLLDNAFSESNNLYHWIIRNS